MRFLSENVKSANDDMFLVHSCGALQDAIKSVCHVSSPSSMISRSYDHCWRTVEEPSSGGPGRIHSLQFLRLASWHSKHARVAWPLPHAGSFCHNNKNIAQRQRRIQLPIREHWQKKHPRVRRMKKTGGPIFLLTAATLLVLYWIWHDSWEG